MGMPLRTDTFDLGRLRLSSGEGRRLDLYVGIDPFELGGERYTVEPSVTPAQLDISRTTGSGYALRLSFAATLNGPCMRCLSPAQPMFEVLAREVSLPGEGEELESPYVTDGVLDLRAWARDALALTHADPGAVPPRLRRAVPGVRGGSQRGRGRPWARARARSALGQALRAAPRLTREELLGGLVEISRAFRSPRPYFLKLRAIWVDY